MPKRISALERLNIASPCSAEWDQMVGNEQVRFCQHCSLHVHDLAKITRKDALKLVAASKGKLCVRYERRPDGTILTDEEAQPLTRIKRRLSRIAAGAFTAAVSLSSTAAAQSLPSTERDPFVRIEASTIIKERARPNVADGPGASIVGTVSDIQDAVVPGAKVTLKDEETGSELKIESNDEGAFELAALAPGTYTLTIESPGFIPYVQEKMQLQNGEERRIKAQLNVGAMGGAVVIMPETPLVNAIWQDDMSEIKTLLNEGVDVNAVDKNVDTTALDQAVASNKLEIVRLMLSAGANPNIKNSNGRTALMYVDDESPAEIIRALLDAGAKINAKAEDGETALIHAAAQNNAAVLQALLDAGAKVNAKTKEGKTALMAAAGEGHLENVKALLLAGADVNRRDEEGASALKYAREQGDENVIATLIAFGAVE